MAVHSLKKGKTVRQQEGYASCFIKLDVDGSVLFNPTEFGFNKAGHVIHGAIHRARHELLRKLDKIDTSYRE